MVPTVFAVLPSKLKQLVSFANISSDENQHEPFILYYYYTRCFRTVAKEKDSIFSLLAKVLRDILKYLVR